ncbi:MAG: hypothetical protein HPY90_14530 [Syntrophothermus sp.]|uniref:hypothetical protein n=1 Tax=Syntrophothermus sp. TaxID=2736299 RepID=UPI00257CA8C2|nr:hypothetical protein [Syntrophothermus sp.]NSW84448.1 hypothetical protein [Syntrophothermus sp.]
MIITKKAISLVEKRSKQQYNLRKVQYYQDGNVIWISDSFGIYRLFEPVIIPENAWNQRNMAMFVDESGESENAEKTCVMMYHNNKRYRLFKGKTRYAWVDEESLGPLDVKYEHVYKIMPLNHFNLLLVYSKNVLGAVIANGLMGTEHSFYQDIRSLLALINQEQEVEAE